VAIGLVVEVEDVRLRVFVGFVLNEMVNRRHVRESLHSKFTVEAASKSIKDLVLLLRSVPD
jgi:hypothetical protein